MTISYETLNNKVLTAITSHLLNVDALPPSTKVSELGLELTEVVFGALTTAGLTREKIEKFGAENIATATARRG